MPLEPFAVAGRFQGVQLIGRPELEKCVDGKCASELFGRSRRVWSAFTIPVDGMHLIVMNATHPMTRQNVTLTEELFHIILKHKPSKIFRCPNTGLLRREYSKQIEDEAYWSAAAAMLPYATLRAMIGGGDTMESIAELFGASLQLVEFRLKVTKLWRLRRQ